MNGLSELNTFGSQSVIVSDSRKARIVFESQRSQTSSEISFANGVFTFRVTKDLYPFEIQEIINYQICLPKLYITIKPSSVSGTTISQTLTSPVTSSNPTSNLEYVLSGYTNHMDWNNNLEFTWNLPSNIANLKSLYLTFRLVWLDQATGVNKEITWDVYDINYYYLASFESNFKINANAVRLQFGQANLITKFVTGRIEGQANLTTVAVASCNPSVTYSISNSLTSSTSINATFTLVRNVSVDMLTKVVAQAKPLRAKFSAQIQTTNTARILYWSVNVPNNITWRINYGDGTEQTYTGSRDVSRSYNSTGFYTITISDLNGNSIPLIVDDQRDFLSSPTTTPNAVRLTKINSWGEKYENYVDPYYTDYRPWVNFCKNQVFLTNVPEYEPSNNLNSFFQNCSSLNDNKLSYWFASDSLVNGQSAFENCSNLNIPSLNNWNVSQATNMTSMFSGATSFNQPLDKWDVSNVTDMSSMFNNAQTFNQPLNTWNVSNVRNMSSMFTSALVFNQPVNNWNVGNVRDMSYMFDTARAFKQSLNSWNVSNVTNMMHMLAHNDFNESLSNWNVSNVRNMSQMFDSNYYFNQPVNNWSVSNVTNMSNMFSNASSFNQPLNGWNVSNVTNMFGMFAAARRFNQPLNNWNVGKVTDMRQMFVGSSSVYNTFDQDISMWKVTQIASKPQDFDTYTPITWTFAEKPRWGV